MLSLSVNRDFNLYSQQDMNILYKKNYHVYYKKIGILFLYV